MNKKELKAIGVVMASFIMGVAIGIALTLSYGGL